jgi:SP family sugar:H+ symporter-like MFS transporter
MTHGGGASDQTSIYDDSSGTGHGVVRIAGVAALGGFLFGYDSAVINGAVNSISERFNVTGTALGMVVASALLGAALGAVTAGRLADRFGRLLVMKVAAVLFLISALGTGLMPDLFLLVAFRVIGGIGVGVASVIAPAYIAEVAPAKLRGRLGSLQQLAIVLGIFASLLVNYLLQSIAGGADQVLWWGLEAWQWMFLVMSIPAILYGGLSFTIPESPRFLVAAGRIPEARSVLGRLLGTANLDRTIERIQVTLKSEHKPRWSDLKGPAMGLMPIVWIGVLLSVFQQFVGINVIFYYSTTLWQAVGFTEDDSFLISVITSVINILTTFIAIALVDRVGRKPLLLIGSVGMVITLGTMAVIFGTAGTDAAGNPVLTGAAGPIALIAANLFVVAFGMSWGPVVWVLLGELFPNRIRAAALSLAAGAQWIANWVITVTFPTLSEWSLGIAYGLYAAFALLSFLFVSRFVRETKGMELEDMPDSVRT